MHIFHTVLCAFPKALIRRICFNSQELLKLVIISSLLVSVRCDSGVILWGDIRCYPGNPSVMVMRFIHEPKQTGWLASLEVIGKYYSPISNWRKKNCILRVHFWLFLGTLTEINYSLVLCHIYQNNNSHHCWWK